MTFTALTEKQKKQIAEHRQKHGSRSANVFRAHLMRGKTKKEAEKKAAERVPNLPPKKERKDKKKKTAEPEEEIKTKPKPKRKKKIVEPEPEPAESESETESGTEYDSE